MPELPPEPSRGGGSAIAWLTAWILFLLILYAISKTPWGHTIIYYLLWLAVVFLLVTHYQEITDLFAAGGIGG